MPDHPQSDKPGQPRPPAALRLWGRPGHLDRPPLPAGHPLSWGLLTHGTPLDGATYPHPVFDLTSWEYYPKDDRASPPPRQATSIS